MFLKKSHFEIVLHVFRKSHFEILTLSARAVLSIKRLARCPGDGNPILIENPSGRVPVAVRSSGGLLSCQRYHVGGIWSLEDVRQPNAFPLVGGILGGVLLGENINLFKMRVGDLGNQFPIAEFIDIYTCIFFYYKKGSPKEKIITNKILYFAYVFFYIFYAGE